MHDELRSASPAGDRRGGVPQGHRARPRRSCTPSSAAAPRSASRAAGPLGRSPRRRGSRSPTPTSRPRSPGAQPLHERPEADQLLRIGARPQLHQLTLRRSRVVERLIDEWLAAHPDIRPLPHLEDDAGPRGEPLDVAGSTPDTAMALRERCTTRVHAPDPPGARRREGRDDLTSAATARPRGGRCTSHMLVPMVIESSSRGERAYDIYSRLLQGADHLPRRRDRGPRRQPGDRPAAVPRVRGPGAGHQPVHQLARRRRHQRPGDLRHDAVRAGARSARSASAWRPAWRPCCSRPAPRASATRCRNSRIMIHQGSGGFRGNAPDAVIQMQASGSTWSRSTTRSSPQHTGQPIEKIVHDTDRDYFMSPDGGQGLWHHRRGLHAAGRSLIAQAARRRG